MAAGWRFSVSVPQWIDGKDDEGQDVVLYRVNVLLQPPGSTGASGSRPPFFVLRRYNQFRHLYEQLKQALPDVMKDRNLAPPPKHALHIRGSKEMCDKRRADLEAWLWKLLGQPAITRSTALRSFLEWDRALARAQAAIRSTMSQADGASSHARSMYAPSDLGDADSVQGTHTPYDPAPHSPAASSSSGPTDLHSHAHTTPGSVYADSTRPGLVHGTAGGRSDGSLAAVQEEVGTSAALRRLGVKLEHRGDVRRLVAMLEARLNQATTDFQAALHEASMLREANRLMSTRMAEFQSKPELARQHELEHQVEELRSQLAEALMAAQHSPQQAAAVPRGLGEVEQLQGQLADAQKKSSDAESALEQADLELEQLRLQLSASEDIRFQLAQQLAEVEASVSSRVQLLTSQVASLQQQLEEAHTENQGLLSRMQDWGFASSRHSTAGGAGAASGGGSSDSAESGTQTTALVPSGADTVTSAEALTSLQSRFQQTEAAHAEALKTLAAAQAELEAERAGRAADKTKARENQTLLAKEVKKLRGEVAALQQQAQDTHASSAAATAGVIGTAAVQQGNQTAADADKLQQEKQELQDKIDALVQEKRDLEQKQAAAESELARLHQQWQAEKASWEHSTQELTTGNQQLSASLSQSQAEVQALHVLYRQASELSQHMQYLTSMHLSSNTALQECTDSVAALEDSVAQLQQQLQAAEADLQRAQLEGEQRVQQLQAELAAMARQRDDWSQQLPAAATAGSVAADPAHNQPVQVYITVSSDSDPARVMISTGLGHVQPQVEHDVASVVQEQAVGSGSRDAAIAKETGPDLKTHAAVDTDEVAGTLREQLAAVRDELAACQQQLVIVMQTLATTQQAAAAQRDQLEAQLQQQVEQVQRLEAELVAANERMAAPASELAAALEAQAAQTDAHMAQLVSLREQHAVELADLRAQHTASREQLAAAQQELEEQSAALEEAQRQVQEHAAQLGVALQQAESHATDAVAARQLVDSHAAELAALQEQHADATAALQAAQADTALLPELQQVKTQLEAQLADATAAVEALRAQLAAAQQANEEFQQQASQLQAAAAGQEGRQQDMQQLQQQLAESQAACQALQADLAELQQQLVSARAEAAEAVSVREQLVSLQQEHQDVQARLEQHAGLEDELASLREQLALASTSASGASSHSDTAAAAGQAQSQGPENPEAQHAADVVHLQATIAALQAEMSAAVAAKQLAIEQQAKLGAQLGQQAAQLAQQLATATELAQERALQLASAEQKLQTADQKLVALEAQLQAQAQREVDEAVPPDGLSEDGDSGSTAAAQADRIRVLQETLAKRDAAIEQQEGKLRDLAAQIAQYNSAAAAAANTRAASAPTESIPRSLDPDTLISLDDNGDAHLTATAHLPAAGLETAPSGTEQPAGPLLPGLQAQAVALQSELLALQQQLQTVAADRDSLRHQLEQAKATEPLSSGSGTSKSKNSSGGGSATHRTGATPSDAAVTALLSVLQAASQALDVIKAADTGPALQRMEAAVEGSIVKAKGGKDLASQSPAQVVAAAADKAMDEFLAALSQSSEQLEHAVAQVSKLSSTAPASNGDESLLLGALPAYTGAQQLETRVPSLLCELLTLLTSSHTALNELRCDKAMSLGERAAAAVRTTSAPQPPQPQRQTSTGRPVGSTAPASSLAQPAQPPSAGNTGGSAGSRGSALSAVTNVLGSGLFGPTVPAATSHPPAPVAQTGVFARLMGSGAPQQHTSPSHNGAGGTSYQPPSYVSPTRPVDTPMAAHGTHHQQQQQSQAPGLFGSLGQRVADRVSSWGHGASGASGTGGGQQQTQPDLLGDLLGDEM